ncbi:MULTISPECIES: tetratricopeptide repeat protein [Gammaproteobacteria]|nr:MULTISPECIES: tetratricopeptide repeat protein [Gammaproteobacteria]ELA9387157.1 sel1 repeat family protein [Vibrio parahaemolyticus]
MDLEKIYLQGVEAFQKQPPAFNDAFIFFEQAATQGHSKSQYNLGQMFYKGVGTKQDLDAAFYWHEQSAKNGIDAGMYETGYEYGNRGDATNALKWLTKSANSGNILAQSFLGHLYGGFVTSPFNVKQDFNKSAHFLEGAAKSGDAKSQFRYSALLLDGKGTPKNEAMALHYSKLAADNNYPDALYTTALMYFNGFGTEKNHDLALYYAEKAMKKGDSEASKLVKHIKSKKKKLFGLF